MKATNYWRLLTSKEKHAFADKAGRAYTMVSNIINGNQVGSIKACRDIVDASEGKISLASLMKAKERKVKWN